MGNYVFYIDIGVGELSGWEGVEIGVVCGK